MTMPLPLEIGLKTDPMEYRYSYEWLFRYMQRRGLRHLQLGTFFEVYHLPDDWFVSLRALAAAHGVRISSVFTAHRELGGFFREERGLYETAYRNFARLIEAGGLLGAACVGCNPGAVPRDRMETKEAGSLRYLSAMEKLLHHAWLHGVETVTFEPMSCLAEPPTLPEEIRAFSEHLAQYHARVPDTAAPGICLDISHGYADADGTSRVAPLEMLEASLPWLAELHLKNTDARYCATFGFGAADRARGVVDLSAVRTLLEAHAGALPRVPLVAYLELGGPKLGRDYSDSLLEAELDASLDHIQEVFGDMASDPTADGETLASGDRPDRSAYRLGAALPRPDREVFLAPSLMCANLCNLEQDVRALELAGADYLHLDVMDSQFTPNMPLGLETIRQLRRITALRFDAHLMVNQNDFFVREMAACGVDMVSVHVESALHLDRTLALIRSLGMTVGAALNPATPLSALDYVLDRLDFVLLMTVNPGYAGQELTPASMAKIADCRAYLRRKKRPLPIQVDGNVSIEHMETMVAVGADILVAGSSSVFRKETSLPNAVSMSRSITARGLARRLPVRL